VWSPPPAPPPAATPPPTPRPMPPPPTDAERTTEFSWPPGQEPPEAPESAPAPAEPEPASPSTSSGWQPAPAEGEWIPAGTPGSNWVAPTVENGSSGEYVGRRRAPEPGPHPQPAMSTPPVELPRRGRHSAAPDAIDPGRPGAPPTLAAESAQPPPHPEPAPPESPATARHRSADETPTGGQSVADLLARLQSAPSGGGGRRRREE
jgi:hypothetical protein